MKIINQLIGHQNEGPKTTPFIFLFFNPKKIDFEKLKGRF